MLASLLFVGLSVVLCFVPLFNLLAFEFALAFTVPAMVLGGVIGLSLDPFFDRRTLARALLRGALPLALALVPITLNMARLRNCNPLEGLFFFILLPTTTLAVSLAWGAVSRRLSTRFGGRIFGVLVLCTFARSAVDFWFGPTVDFFHPFVGYYPGSLYDEVIPISSRLVVSRLEDLAFAFGALAILRGDARLRVLTTVSVGLVYVAASQQDLHRTTDSVTESLGGQTRTAHLILIYPKDLSAARLTDLETELEFRHAELTVFFGRAPAEPITVWLYQDAAQKKRLMGAAHVRIAKPWQRAVHIHAPQIGDGVLAHELAHAFSAEMSNAPHHLSLGSSLLPNMGLIEGLAVAAAWDEGLLDAHAWTRALRELDLDTPMETLLDPFGFLGVNARAAYTQCGSFVRYVHDEVGLDAMERLYREGRLEPEDPALSGWRAHVDALPQDALALAVARVRFDRPAIFGRTCAHEIAALRDRAEQAVSRGDSGGSVVEWERVLGHVPEDLDARLSLMDALRSDGQTERAVALANAIIAEPRAGTVRSARARELLADVAALRGDANAIAEARSTFDALLKESFDRAAMRRLAVKRFAVGAGAYGDHLLAALTERGPKPDDGRDELQIAVGLVPVHPVSLYLGARALIRAGDCGAAVPRLQAAADALPHPSLTLEAHRLVAMCAFDDRAYTVAATAFLALSSRVDLNLQRGERDGLEVWGRRARFFAQHHHGPGN